MLTPSQDQPPCQGVARIDLFACLDPDAQALIQQKLTAVDVVAGEIICREGDPGTCMYIIASGEVLVSKAGDKGQTVEIARLQVGELVGEMSLFEQAPRSATVRATGPVRMWRLEAVDFTALLDQHPRIARQLLARLSSRLRRETAILAFDFGRMQANLAEHIEQLKLTQTARDHAESELRIAGQIQETFLPGPFDPAECGGRIQLQAAMKTARHAGGDLFDYFPLDAGHLFFAIGDVSGKGMPAAMFMSAMVVLLRTAARQWRDPAEILQRVNDTLAVRNQSCMFVTLFIGILDVRTGEVVFANGGHTSPRRRSIAGSVAPVPTRTNMVVGALECKTFARETLTLQPGETLILYTDGITEAFNAADQLYGEKRMDRRLAALPAEASAADLIADVMNDVAAFAGAREQSDDITMLAVRYNPGLDSGTA